jgi:hypothetical protein
VQLRFAGVPKVQHDLVSLSALFVKPHSGLGQVASPWKRMERIYLESEEDFSAHAPK